MMNMLILACIGFGGKMERDEHNHLAMKTTEGRTSKQELYSPRGSNSMAGFLVKKTVMESFPIQRINRTKRSTM
jgi:hypothetical protein